MNLSDCHKSEDFLRFTTDEIRTIGVEEVSRAHQAFVRLENEKSASRRRNPIPAGTPLGLKSLDDVRGLSQADIANHMDEVKVFMAKIAKK